jgi:hypothetical protein
MITAPGIFDVPELDYHADRLLAPQLGRSLSASGMKTILRCPALFQHEREHGRTASDSMGIGTVAHALALGNPDSRLRVYDAYDWRAKAHQAGRAADRAQRLTPVHRGELRQASRIAASVRRHATARNILSRGEAERSVYWIDDDTGVTCRARVDWLRDDVIVDFKTAADASPAGFARAVANFRYDIAAAHYIEGVKAVTGHDLPYVFVVAETAPPHLCAVYQLDPGDLEWGRYDAARARRIYAECESSGEWPDYGDEIHTLDLPAWFRRTREADAA